MRIGHNFTPQSTPRSAASPAGPVQPVQPVQPVDFPLRSNEITVYKPENFSVSSFLIPQGAEWNMTVDEPYLLLWTKTVFEMAFQIQQIFPTGNIRLEINVKNNTKGIKPYRAVASEGSDEVRFYPFNGRSVVDLNPRESLGIKFDDRDDLIYAVHFDGIHENDPSLAEVTLHVTNIVK